MTINATDYHLHPLEVADRSFDITRAFRLMKVGADEIYDVTAHQDGHHECTCPDHVFRRDGIDPAGCKHARALSALGLL